MKVSINILCWNTFRTTELILDVLREELKFTSHEIIIVDNGSTDTLKSMHENVLGCKIIRNDKNMGISIGKNQGIRASKGEFIVMLDGDLVPVPNSILMLIDYMENNQSCDALGFLPNKFSLERNRGHVQDCHEKTCHTLFNPRVSPCVCLYYGIFRRSIFDRVMMDESGPFGECGYGWEDHDFFETMKAAGITQMVCGMNTENGKYYHAINSSIKVMGHEEYKKSEVKRSEYFKKKWSAIHA